MRARVRMALPVTLLVHVTTALCALAASLPLAAAVPAGKVLESPAVGGLFTAIKLLDIAAASPWRIGALPLFVTLALTPFLRLVWLRSQLIAAPLHEHARFALPVYWQALAICAACALYQLLLALGGWSCASLARLVLAGTHDARLQTCAGLVLAVPWLWAMFVHAPTLADLAHLALVRGAVRSRLALGDAWQRLGKQACAARTGYAVVMGALLLAGYALRLVTDSELGRTAWSFVFIGQVSAALQTALRAAWCAWLVEHVEQRIAPAERPLAAEPVPAGALAPDVPEAPPEGAGAPASDPPAS